MIAMSKKSKMITLLILGLCLSMIVMVLLQNKGFLRWDIYLFVTITCYPLAIFYGRNYMVDVFKSIRSGPYSPFRLKFGSGSVSRTMYPIFNFIVAGFMFIFVGWIYGVYHAYKTYQMSKGYIVK